MWAPAASIYTSSSCSSSGKHRRASEPAAAALLPPLAQQQQRFFSKFKGGSLREKGVGGGVKQGKGGKGAVDGGVAAVEEELLTIDPAELELPPGTKTDSAWRFVAVVLSCISIC